MNEISKGVRVNTCTAQELLCVNGVMLPERTMKQALQGTLYIPEYQRPYRWGVQQIVRLLDDLKAHDDSLGNPDKKPDLAYYLGSAILHDDGKHLNIIDGQQRITTLALLGHLSGKLKGVTLRYESPISQQQIKANLDWLRACDRLQEIKEIDFDKLQFTLVVTKSEDDAYQFFETQNTGGVRLSGPDIIKAHHLRSVAKEDNHAVNGFAQKWESMGDLSPVVDALLRGRYWQALKFKNYPRQVETQKIRTCIVGELAEQTKDGEDAAFSRITRTYSGNGGEQLSSPKVGYDLRQPLNSGANTIHYLQYFEGLRQKYLCQQLPYEGELAEFYNFYQKLICTLGGCGYIKQLYDACLLLYISQFGEQQLHTAAKKMFRVVYSRRVYNRKAVKEASIPSFVEEFPVLDWIALSYTPEQCFELFDGFKLQVTPDGLAKSDNGVKKQFVNRVRKDFGLEKSGVTDDISTQEAADAFAREFTDIVKKL